MNHRVLSKNTILSFPTVFPFKHVEFGMNKYVDTLDASILYDSCDSYDSSILKLEDEYKQLKNEISKLEAAYPDIQELAVRRQKELESLHWKEKQFENSFKKNEQTFRDNHVYEDYLDRDMYNYYLCLFHWNSFIIRKKYSWREQISINILFFSITLDSS